MTGSEKTKLACSIGPTILVKCTIQILDTQSLQTRWYDTYSHLQYHQKLNKKSSLEYFFLGNARRIDTAFILASYVFTYIIYDWWDNKY